MRLISAIRGPLNQFQGDYLCSLVTIRGWQKIQKFLRYIAQDFPQYFCERKNRLTKNKTQKQ
jgi:hypothetical protein